MDFDEFAVDARDAELACETRRPRMFLEMRCLRYGDVVRGFAIAT